MGTIMRLFVLSSLLWMPLLVAENQVVANKNKFFKFKDGHGWHHDNERHYRHQSYNNYVAPHSHSRMDVMWNDLREMDKEIDKMKDEMDDLKEEIEDLREEMEKMHK